MQQVDHERNGFPIAHAKCESKDGVLTVHIPKKKEPEKRKPIEIKVQ